MVQTSDSSFAGRVDRAFAANMRNASAPTAARSNNNPFSAFRSFAQRRQDAGQPGGPSFNIQSNLASQSNPGGTPTTASEGSVVNFGGRVGISVIIWDSVKGLSTRVLGHVSYMISGDSYSFDASGYHKQYPGKYLEQSAAISGGTEYHLNFKDDHLNWVFKDSIMFDYRDWDQYYTGVNNCGSAFGRAINKIADTLGLPQNDKWTPDGMQTYLLAHLTPYLVATERIEKGFKMRKK